RGKAVFLVAWTLFPVLATQGYLVGLAVDYNRVLFFFAQPLMILVAAPLVHLGGAWRRLRGLKLSGTSVALGRRLVEGTLLPKQFGRKVAAVLLLALTVSSMAYTALAGSVTIGNVNTWYNSPNIDPYGDQLALQAVNYIHASTSPTAVIVAEYPIGRWIEGIAQRRVVLQLDPRYLFLTGEVDREYAARAIMTSDHGIRNGYAWVLDQAPYGTYSPLISFFTQGEYANMVYVNDTLTQVTWENTATGLNYTRPLTNATTITSSWVTNDSQGATLAVTYGFGAFSVTRSVGLTASSGYVNLSFNASSNNPHVVVTNLAVAVISFPGAGPDSASLVGNRTLMETTSVGPIYFYSSSFTAFPFDFTGNALTGGITGSITMWNGGDGNGTFLYAYDRPQVLSQFGVTDIVIPNTAPLLVPVGQPVRIERNIQTSSLYQNLLKDPEFSVVYFNDQDIVLTVASQSGG
ncbi:MAG TPA: hypothetical protein VJR06_01685, partial [Nitrososphaerales archaeon]|nr:hypothetical protein [Nitrososphaerales archaeon]